MSSLFVFIAVQAIGQQELPEQKAETKIHAVKLHLQGAEVSQKTNLQLPKGRSQLIFTGLSSKLYPQTIQLAAAESSLRIVSVTSKINYLSRTKEDRRIEQLRDSVEFSKGFIDLLQNEKNAYNEEKEVLKANRFTKGGDDNIDLELLKAAAEYQRKRSLEIGKVIIDIDKKMIEENKKIFDYKLQLHELNANKQPTSDIYVVIEGDKAVSSDFNLSYVVSDCGWAAIYDLESGNYANEIELRYRALAFNNTGIDWNDVKLTLSTSDPLQNSSQPIMSIWSLDDVSAYAMNDNISTMNINNSNVVIQQNAKMGIEANKQEAKDILGEDYKADVDYETERFREYQLDRANTPKQNTASLDIPDFNADFEIEKPYTIPSDRRPYSIDVKNQKLSATYKYYAVPKMDKDAFLLAQVVGWEDLNLVSGPVNIYNEKKYVGQSFLNIRSISDTLQISLGRDKDIVITRTKVKGSSSKVLLGNMKKSTIAYDIDIRNGKNKAIDIEIFDQMPITTDKDVTISLDNRGDAEFDEKTGELHWRFSLKPAETKKLNFGFSIKYPKDRQVNIQYKKARNIQQMRYF